MGDCRSDRLLNKDLSSFQFPHVIFSGPRSDKATAVRMSSTRGPRTELLVQSDQLSLGEILGRLCDLTVLVGQSQPPLSCFCHRESPLSSLDYLPGHPPVTFASFGHVGGQMNIPKMHLGIGRATSIFLWSFFSRESLRTRPIGNRNLGSTLGIRLPEPGLAHSSSSQ